MCRFVEKYLKWQNLTFGDLWSPGLYDNRSSFAIVLFYALLNAAYRVSLHGPGAELEGGGSITARPDAFGAEQRLGAG